MRRICPGRTIVAIENTPQSKESYIFFTPGTPPDITQKFTREAAERVASNWWLLLITGLLEIPLGVLALANPSATLTALISVAGIWAVAIGVMRVAMSFELKRLPRDVDSALATAANGAGSRGVHAGNGQPAPAAH